MSTIEKASDIVALVLAGGKATRMGYAKERINYHGKENLYFQADMLSMYFKDVFISIPNNYQFPLDDNYNYIVDQESEIGPIEGIYQCLNHNLGKAVFVLAVDLPAVGKDEIEILLKSRNKNKFATLFKNPEGFFEPLCAIWEAKSKEVLKGNIQTRQYKLQSFLRNHPVEIAQLFDYTKLININRPQQREEYENLK